MVQADAIKAAYEKLEAARELLFEATEASIEAAQARERAFMDAMNRARVEDEITDPGKLQQRGDKGSRTELTAQHLAEKKARRAQHVYTMESIRVDSLNQQLKAEKQYLPGGDESE